MHRYGTIIFFAIVCGLSGCGYKDLPQFRQQAELALKDLVMQYRLRADIAPHLLDLVKGRTEKPWPTLIGDLQAAYGHAVAMDLPLEQFNEMQMNRMASFQTAFSTSLNQFMAALEKDAKVNKAQLLSLKEQLDRAENQIAVARQKYRVKAPAFNHSLNKIPQKWYNQFVYKYQPLWDLQ